MSGNVLQRIYVGLLERVFDVHIEDPFTKMEKGVLFLTSFIMGGAGFIAGLWADKFDHMATVTNWIDHLSAKEVAGAIYPGVGTEGLLVLIALVLWIGWHVVSARQEN